LWSPVGRCDVLLAKSNELESIFCITRQLVVVHSVELYAIRWHRNRYINSTVWLLLPQLDRI